ncbi:MAG TPA: phage holin family protein [Pseudomonas sp.]|nr:phage holin family protein [Pseudomonas sp.]
MNQNPEEQPSAATHAAEGLSLFALLRLLRSAGRAVFAQAALHGQLARVEWAEEKQRLLRILVTTVFGFVCLLCLMLLGNALVLALSWATPYRIHALVGLICLHGLAVAIAWHHVRRLVRQGSSFAATRAEVAADIALIKRNL